MHIELTSSATVAGTLKHSCQGYDIGHQNVEGIQHKHDFHYAAMHAVSDEGTVETTRIVWSRKD